MNTARKTLGKLQRLTCMCMSDKMKTCPIGGIIGTHAFVPDCGRSLKTSESMLQFFKSEKTFLFSKDTHTSEYAEALFQFLRKFRNISEIL